MNLKEKQYASRLIKIKWDFNECYQMNFITPKNYSKITEILSEIRADKDVNYDDWIVLSEIYKSYNTQYYEIKEKIKQEPRKHAQKFIGRKKIRNFIFNRDKYRCLCCGTHKKLTIDHIIPVSKNGENKISNLQTLCKSCNSKKSDNFKDYR